MQALTHTETTEMLPELLQAVIASMPVATVLVGPDVQPLVWSHGCDLLRCQLLSDAAAEQKAVTAKRRNSRIDPHTVSAKDEPVLALVSSSADGAWLRQLLDDPERFGVTVEWSRLPDLHRLAIITSVNAAADTALTAVVATDPTPVSDNTALTTEPMVAVTDTEPMVAVTDTEPMVAVTDTEPTGSSAGPRNYTSVLASEFIQCHLRGRQHFDMALLLRVGKLDNVSRLQGAAAAEQLNQMVCERLLHALEGAVIQSLNQEDILVLTHHDCIADAGTTPACDEHGNPATAWLTELLCKPYLARGEVHELTPYIGITSIGSNPSPENILQQAECALLEQVGAGKAGALFFREAMLQSLQTARQLETDLRKAIYLEQLFVVYQPQIFLGDTADSGGLRGFEALVRWQHPTLGLIAPDQFISMAETSGIIVELGKRVLRIACTDACSWPEDTSISVNVSPVQLQSGNFVRVVQDVLRQTGLPPQRLELEITESVKLDEDPLVREQLVRIRDLGVSIALDDFGTGYASLSYLRCFPFDKLKIDQSFVRSEEAVETNRALAAAMASVGKQLGMIVVAEGVETAAHVQQLGDVGCDLGQGYFYSKPVKLEGTRELVTRWHKTLPDVIADSTIETVTATPAAVSHTPVNAALISKQPDAALVSDNQQQADGQDMLRLVYLSDNCIEGDDQKHRAVIDSIMEKAVANNRKNGISGALMFNRHMFAQVLEGPSSMVESTFEIIQRDSRHANVQVLDFRSITERSFGNWAMAFIGETNATTAHFESLAEATGFNESAVQAEAIFAILKSLVSDADGQLAA